MTNQSLGARIEEILAALERPHLFDNTEHHEELSRLGLDAMTVLLEREDLAAPTVADALRKVVGGLPTESRGPACLELTRLLLPERAPAIRALALSVIDEFLRDVISYVERTIEIARNPKEPSDLRIRAINILGQAPLTSSQVKDLEELLDLTRLAEPNVRAAAFSCLDRQAHRLRSKPTMKRLDPFLSHPDPTIRVQAIDLLGAVGDLRDIERTCMLPRTAEEIHQLQQSLGRILLRPLNLLSLRPEHFEELILQLLRKMGHEDVERVGKSHDGGIDVISSRERMNIMGPARERWVVQCKRWTADRVDEHEIQKLIATSRERDAKHALLITTSEFTASARDHAKKNTSAVELVSGTALLDLLAQYFGQGRYTIRPHD